MSTSIAERQQHVSRMRANFALEDMHADAADLFLQNAYIAGDVALEDLLAYARAFALAQAGNSPMTLPPVRDATRS